VKMRVVFIDGEEQFLTLENPEVKLPLKFFFHFTTEEGTPVFYNPDLIAYMTPSS